MFISSVYFIHIPGASRVCYFYDWNIWIFFVRGRPLAGRWTTRCMNEKDITPFSQTRLEPSPRLKCNRLEPSPRLKCNRLEPSPKLKCNSSCFNWNKLALTDPKIYQCICFVSRCTQVHFFSEHVYKNYLNVLIELWSNPGLHLVNLQILLSKATYNWGIHKAINLEEANRQRKWP